MIGSLRGKLIDKTPPILLLEVAGIGYEVNAPMSTWFSLPDLGQEIFIHTHMVVREDAHLLFGFATLNERALFRNLIKINNVGPRLALAILSSLEPNAFVQCVMQHDVATLVRVPGVGKKTAERLIIEMRDRLEELNDTGSSVQSAPRALHSEPDPRQDAMSALLALGYKSDQARRALASIDSAITSSEDMIKFALQNIQ